MSTQLDMFECLPLELIFEEEKDPDGLRYYQRDTLGAIYAGLKEWRSVMAVLATGLGKTQIFCALAHGWTDGDVLILAHRDELVHQAADRYEQMYGIRPEIEQRDFRASAHAHVVVASIDTIKQQNRLERMGKNRFGLIIVDELHHYVAKTYRRPLDYFENAKIAGFTATPDRGDKKALGKIIDDVAYVFDIADAIDDGWLVPIRGQEVILEGLDISNIKKTGGDLQVNELDDAMAKVVNGIVDKTLELGGDRQGIGFFPGVRSAELAMLRFNELRPGSAAFISGSTPLEERRRIVADFKHGRVQYLCNCQVATEGFDAPNTSLIIMGRPTLSRSLYTQMAGRGTRPRPNALEGLVSREEGHARRSAISVSGKPDLLILDFVGNSGKHSLIGPADLLGGSYAEAEVKAAKEKIKKNPGMNVGDALRQARAELKRLAQQAYTKTGAKVRPFDPFHVLDMNTPDEVRYAQYGKVAPATSGQLDALRRFKVEEQDLRGLSKKSANQLLGELSKRRKQGLSTYNQLRYLKLHGVDDPKVSFENASKALDYLFGTKRSKGYVDPRKLSGLALGKKW